VSAIERISSFDDAEWDRRLYAHAEATLFHGRAWARFLKSVFPALEDRSLWLRVDGRDHFLPLFAWRRAGGLLTTLHSSFPFLYGGLVPTSPALSLPTMLPRGASLRVTGNPFAPESAAGSGPSDRTHLLVLPSTEEAYWDEVLSTAKRNDVRRLTKKGVEISASRDLAEVRAVYELYLGSFARWGGRPGFVYPLAYYEGLLGQLGEAARFTVARHEGRLLGGAFTVRANGLVHYLAGYFDPEARSLRPNVLLQIESIQDAIRGGARCYDFLPSGGHASVEEFKAGLGGVPTPFSLLERRGPLHAAVDRLRGAGKGRGEGG